MISNKVLLNEMNDDQNFLNIKEKELLFHLTKSVFTVPVEHGERAVRTVSTHLEAEFSKQSASLFEEIMISLLPCEDSKGMPGEFTRHQLLDVLNITH